MAGIRRQGQNVVERSPHIPGVVTSGSAVSKYAREDLEDTLI